MSWCKFRPRNDQRLRFWSFLCQSITVLGVINSLFELQKCFTKLYIVSSSTLNLWKTDYYLSEYVKSEKKMYFIKIILFKKEKFKIKLIYKTTDSLINSDNPLNNHIFGPDFISNLANSISNLYSSDGGHQAGKTILWFHYKLFSLVKTWILKTIEFVDGVHLKDGANEKLAKFISSCKLSCLRYYTKWSWQHGWRHRHCH